MMLLLPLFLLAGTARVWAKSVFAHFMVGNTAEFTSDDWVRQMSTAGGSGIDAFALNVAYADAVNDVALPLAFSAAESLGFKLFFSLDYAGNGPWPNTTVHALITKYASSSAYFKRGSQPLVSTFEGPANMDDWPALKSSLDCFFIPDWSSLGAQDAVAPGIADGLFSWDAWPKAEQNMTTYPDASYYQFLNGLPYMMPVSPWFYTNLPGYQKNWLWRGDDLWFHRWQQIISIDNPPEFVEIISWNDFGESHYIGPLDSRQYDAFTTGQAPYNYVSEMPHDGWREFLPYYISLYKSGSAVIEEEAVVTWYRLNLAGSCDDGGTTGDTATQLHLEYPPGDLMTDRVYFDALLTSAADVIVSIGGASQAVPWDFTPYGGVGVYHGSVPLNGATGAVTVTITRAGAQILTIAGEDITTDCAAGKYNNYNAWVGVERGPTVTAVSPKENLADLNCTRGTGVYEFTDICAFTCANGYCPSSACVCLAKGVANPPEIVGVDGYPAAGQSAILLGLCSFACNHGYCPSDLCSTTPNEGEVPTFSPFLPPACRAGTGTGAFTGLCSFGCNYGFCPMHACTCTGTGVLIDAPPKTGKTGYFADGTEDYGLCNFAVGHGYTPDVCAAVTGGDGGGPGRDEQTVSLGPEVWTGSTAACDPPCILVFPPIILGQPTTIDLPPITTSLEIGGYVDGTYTATTVVTVITQPAVTTTAIGISNVPVTTTTSGAAPAIIYPSPSLSPSPFRITPSAYPNIPGTPVPRMIHPPPWPYGVEGAGTGTATQTSSSTSTTSLVVLYWPTADPTPVTTFPPDPVTWVTNWVPKATVTTINGAPTPVIPCWVWFIWICPPNFGGIALTGWLPGIYPPGGPPAIGPPPVPPGVTLPPIAWPEITILPDRTPVYPIQPNPQDDLCETATASVCTSTLSYDVVAKRGRPAAAVTPAPGIPYEEYLNVRKRATTTSTTTISFCTQVTGCGAQDITRTSSEQSTATAWPRVVIPNDPNNVDAIRAAITQQTPIDYESRSDYLGTIFFYLHTCTDDQAETIRAVAGVADVYVPRGPLTQAYYPVINVPSEGEEGVEYSVRDMSNSTSHVLDRRASIPYQNYLIDLEMLQLSWPPTNGAMGLSGDGLDFNYDDSAGKGSYVYSCDYGVDPDHDELSNLGSQIQPLYPGPFPLSNYYENDPKRHGTKCIAKMAGKNLGLAKKATVSATVLDFSISYYEHFLDALVKIYDDIYTRARGKMAVVNLSVSINKSYLGDAYQAKMAFLIRQIIGTGAVFVTGSGNAPGSPYGYPALFGDPSNANYIEDLIVVGSVQVDGSNYDLHCAADWVTVYAPGTGIILPDPSLGDSRYTRTGGTSYAGAGVSGLAAYLRGVSPGTFDTAAAVKAEILRLAYARKRGAYAPASALYERKCVWNGQQGSDTVVGGGGSIALPPVPPPVSFHTGLPSPTCTPGAVCGTVCAGYFCANSNLTHNPDFEDPQNPDSVQNPTGPNYGDWDGTTPLATPTSTKTTTPSKPSSTGDPSAVALIPDCLAVYIITDSSTSGDAKGTIDGTIVYKGVSTTVCGGASWCTDFRDYADILPPVCSAGPLICGSGYSGSATQVVSRGTLSGWIGVHFQAPDMSKEAYFEVPLTMTSTKACSDTVGSQIGSGSCQEERYGAYFGGDCSAYPLFESWTTNGLISELSKEDAVATHPIDSSVTN